MCFWILLGLIQTSIYLYPGLVNTMEGDHPKRYLSVRCISESHLGHSLFFEGKWTFKQSRVMSFWRLVNDCCTWCIVTSRIVWPCCFFSLTSDCCESQKSCLFMYVLWVQICDVSNIITQRLYWKPSIQLGSSYFDTVISVSCVAPAQGVVPCTYSYEVYDPSSTKRTIISKNFVTVFSTQGY